MAADAPVGVLLMAYGTPASPDEIAAYYAHVRRGRPPSPEQLAELQGRYAAIGGTSPLLERTRAQAAGVQSQLGDGYRVELGMKHAPPFIEDGAAALAAAGARTIVGLVLAPHFSQLSVGEYAERAAKAAAAAGATLEMVESWHLERGYVSLLAAAVGGTGAPEEDRTEVVFTAHSLPARILASGDPYPAQLHETAAAVAAEAGVTRWSVAWQSAGRTPEPWIGPDILEVLDARAAAGDVDRVVVCPAGFVSDHLEVLYDLDIEATERARRLGLGFARTTMPNDDARFCAAIAAVVRRRA